MGAGARQSWIWAAVWAGFSCAGMVLAGAEAQRYPVSGALIVVGVVVPAVGIGYVLNRFRWALLGFLYVPFVLVAAKEAHNVLLVLTVPLAVPAVATAIAVGVAARRMSDRRAANEADTPLVRGLAAGTLAVALVPYAVAYADKHRTVRVHGPRPIAIEESRGLVSGVGLGNRPAEVTARFGGALPRSPTDSIGSLDDEGDYPRGPGVLPRLEPERDLTYRHLFFAADRRVRYLEITDRRARLSKGIGPGDSISLVRHAYPGLTCDEDDAGEDEPIPYPVCHGRLGRRVYAYISGDYGKPGAPVVEIWLADFPLAQGDG